MTRDEALFEYLLRLGDNTLILGPGGYAFGDYWRMGLPLEGIVLLVGIPMILLVWPL